MTIVPDAGDDADQAKPISYLEHHDMSDPFKLLFADDESFVSLFVRIQPKSKQSHDDCTVNYSNIHARCLFEMVPGKMC